MNSYERFQVSQGHYYKQRRRQWRCHLEDRIMKREHPWSSTEKAVTAKLRSKYSGPYTVTKVISSSV